MATALRTALQNAVAVSRRSICLTLAVCAGLLVLCGAGGRTAVAHAADVAPGTVSLDQPAYSANESQGELPITIQRTGDLSGEEHVGYGVKRQDAQAGIDFNTISNTYVTFAPGQSTLTFNVQIIDRGINSTPVHALAYLYSSYPDSLGANDNSLITILHDDVVQPRDDANPLATSSVATGNPLAGTRFYVNPESGAAVAERASRRSRPSLARDLSDIAAEPSAHRLYMWNLHGNIAGQVSHFLEGTQVQQPGTTVMLSTYSLVHGKCGSTATPAVQARYDAFINQVAQGIGNFRVVVYLELDSLITAPCLNPAQLAIRDAELKYAVSALETDPHAVVYLDGGAADAASASRQAAYLRGAGVEQAQGFFLNSTHFDWMTSELHYGQQISRMLGGSHFVINSAENGRGPLRPHNRVKHGNEVLCNPAGRGLGPLSVSNGVALATGYAAADGFLWFSNPGGSGGQCVAGAPPTGVFWPAYAAMLAKNWVHKVSGPHYDLTRG
jgi:endoglucanase